VNDLTSLAWRLVRGTLLGLAAFALVAHGVLLCGGSVWAGLLPVVLLGALAAQRDDGVRPVGPPAPLPLRAGALVLLAVVFAALCYGALATPARHWDGVVSWEMKAMVLAAAPTLDQPFFTDHAVYAQSREYPLLQPLVQASVQRLAGAAAGRALFPALWLVLVALAGSALRRAGLPGTHAWLAALGIGTMPMLVSPTSGAVDSGYAELAILTTLTAAAAAFLAKDGWLLGACCVVAVFLKPEGTVYAGAIAACAWLLGPRRLATGAVLGTAVALAVWLPLLDFLRYGPLHAAEAPWATRLAVFAGGAILAGALHERVPRIGARAALLAVAGATAAAAWCLLPGEGAGALSAYAHNLADLPQRAARTPELLVAGGEQAIAVRRFGLLFPLVACALWGGWRDLDDAGRAVAVLLAFGWTIVAVSMLLAPETDFAHHVRSSLHRLLLQWTGVAVVCAALCLRPQASAARIPSP